MKIPRSMRALCQTSLDGPAGLRLDTIPVPEPARGELLIRVAAAGVNFVDSARGRGTFGEKPTLPFVAGFEAAGEVVKVGDGVDVPLGATVISAGPGAFAEYALARAVMPVPAGWTPAQALGLVINWPTALAVLKLARVTAGETLLVHAAAGATGQAIVTLAKHRGARVIAVVSRGKHVVADQVIEPRHALPTADIVVESAGGTTFEASLAAAKRITGRVVVIGLAGGEASIRNWDLVYKHPVQLVGFNLGALIGTPMFAEIMAELMALIAAGVVEPGRPTTYPLADGARALADLESRATTGKLALLP